MPVSSARSNRSGMRPVATEFDRLNTEHAECTGVIVLCTLKIMSKSHSSISVCNNEIMYYKNK